MLRSRPNSAQALKSIRLGHWLLDVALGGIPWKRQPPRWLDDRFSWGWYIDDAPGLRPAVPFLTSPWAKSEKATVWSHEREQRFDTSNLFFNLWKTVMAWSYWAEACKTWRKWAKSVLPVVAMATGHRFSRNPPFNASKGCVKWSKGINYSWETLDFARLQKNREIRSQKTRFFLAFLQAVAITYWNL